MIERLRSWWAKGAASMGTIGITPTAVTDPKGHEQMRQLVRMGQLRYCWFPGCGRVACEQDMAGWWWCKEHRQYGTR